MDVRLNEQVGDPEIVRENFKKIAAAFKIATGLPDQAGNTGKYLTTDGAVASWAAIAGGIIVTKSEVDILISSGQLLPYQNYLITGVDPTLYGGTDIILKAASTTLFETKGSGFFYNPKYTSDPGAGIWTRFMEGTFTDVVGDFDFDNMELVTAQNGATGNIMGNGFIEWLSGDWSSATSITGGTATATVTGFTSPSYAISANVIWGGKHWLNVNGNVGDALDEFSLDAEWTVVPFDETDYNLVVDSIEYDYLNDSIYSRQDLDGNKVEGNIIP